MTETTNNSAPFPEHMKVSGPPESLDSNKIYDQNKDPKIRDIIVFGPVLFNQKGGHPWTIGMKGYRWSTLENNGDMSAEVTPDIAHEFATKSIRSFRKFEPMHNPKKHAGLGTTSMDVDILVPTLLVVVSPVPCLTFNQIPITAKTDFENRKFGKIDGNCKSAQPKLWSFADGQSEWSTGEAHILTWYSEYDGGEKSSPTLETHNYNMILSSAAVDSKDTFYATDKPLPIIFDPGNNNGGAGRRP